jgi:hypothetical protein
MFIRARHVFPKDEICNRKARRMHWMSEVYFFLSFFFFFFLPYGPQAWFLRLPFDDTSRSTRVH